MESLSQINLSRQMALRSLMDVTANNIANMNTPGFKSQNLAFSQQIKEAQAKTSQDENLATYRDLSQGVLSPTFNKLDMAIQGEGYFAVQTQEGVRYTRDGSFALNNNGQIVTKSGYPVLNNAGAPLAVQSGAVQVNVAEDGTVSTEKGSVGKLKVAAFDDPQNLLPLGDNLQSAENAREKPLQKPQVIQAMLENSNVQPIFEMNKMIEILRLYQSTQNILSTDHEMARGMIQKLTKV